MKKLLLILFLLIAGTSFAQMGMFKTDSLIAGDSTWTVNPYGKWEYTYFELRPNADADSVQCYHSFDGEYWSPVSLKRIKLWSTGETEADTIAITTATTETYMVMFPFPERLMLVSIDAYEATRRIDFAFSAKSGR